MIVMLSSPFDKVRSGFAYYGNNIESLTNPDNKKTVYAEPFIEVVLNILLLLPIGFIISSLFQKKKLSVSLAVGFTISLLVEMLQLVSFRGWFDVDDLIHNTLGAVLGGLLYKKILRSQSH